jgi:hypothetical protein
LADNLQAYPFVCSCHHCHSVFGPPPETISLSKMLPREHTTKRTYPGKKLRLSNHTLSTQYLWTFQIEHFRYDKNAAWTSQR